MNELKILELSPSHAFGEKKVVNADQDRTQIDEYTFESVDLSMYNALYITEFVDQEYLYNNKQIILDFLNEKKIVIFCGHLFREWLPGCSMFMPKKIRSYKDYFVKSIPKSPLFNDVEINDMVFNKGVAGFFARGFYSPPQNAEILLTFADEKVVSYIDHYTTKGTILVHAGRSLLDYKYQNKTTDKISDQTFKLLKSEIDKLNVE